MLKWNLFKNIYNLQFNDPLKFFEDILVEGTYSVDGHITAKKILHDVSYK